MIDSLLSYESPVFWGVLTTLLFIVATLIVFRFIILPLTKKFLEIQEALDKQKLINEVLAQKIRTVVFLDIIEKERKRISAELNDLLLPNLYKSKLNIEEIKSKKNIHDKLLDDTIEYLAEASDDLKNIIYELTPVELDVVDLEHGLSKLINNYTKFHKMNLDVRNYSIPPDIEKNRALVIYRAVKELLQNVKKHAKAGYVILNIYNDKDRMIINIKDDGVGFEARMYRVGKGLGYGLSNILASVEKLNGKMDIKSAKGEGTEVYIEIPIN
ncbi:MAG: ATP-binding protein [Ignavibacteria bacterium]|jgi:signal transduction histidine kinase